MATAPVDLTAAKNTRENMDYTGQQAFLKQNAGFDLNTYGFSPAKTLEPVQPVEPIKYDVAWKSYNIEQKNWTYWFESQWGMWYRGWYKTADEAKAVINEWNKVTPPVIEPTKVTTDNGKSYDVNVDPTTGKASFTSQAPGWATVVKNSLQEATDYIKSNNQKAVAPAPTQVQSNANTPEVLAAQKEAEANALADKTKADKIKSDQAMAASYKNDDPKRIAEVKANLDQATIDNPWAFKDVATYDSTFHYSERSDAQKAVLDDFWVKKWIQTSLNQKSASELAYGVVNWDFSDADIDFLKNSINPADQQKYQEIQTDKIAENNKLQSKIVAQSYNALFWDWDKNGKPDFIDQMNTQTDKATKALEDYYATKNDPTMVQAVTDMKTLQDEITQAQADQMDAKKKIEEQYGSLPKALLNAMVADATNDLQTTIMKKTSTYNSQLGIYNSKLAVAKDEYDMQTARVKADTDKINSALTTFNAMSWYQQNMINNTKPTVTANPLWGFASTSYNAATGQWETTNTGASWSTDNSSVNPTNWPGWGITNEQWTSYSQDQKNQIIDQMAQQEWWTDGSRAKRNNNPTAMTTDVAKQWGLVLWKDYTEWEAFTWDDGKVYHTAKLLWDAYALTTKVIDKIGFQTQAWWDRRTYLSKLWLWGWGWGNIAGYSNNQIATLEKAFKATTEQDALKALNLWWLKASDLEKYRAYKKEQAVWADFTPDEIKKFNSLNTYSDIAGLSETDKLRYQKFMTDKEAIFNDPKASIESLIKYSKWQTKLDVNSKAVYKWVNTVITQLDWLENNIKQYQKNSFWGNNRQPLVWLLNNLNPWDTKSQEIKAQLTALVPQIAKGIFWEKWVLSDQDIKNYMKTLPALKQTANVQDAVMLTLLWTLKATLASNLRQDASFNDVSQQGGRYKQISDKYDTLYKKTVDTNPKISNPNTGWNILPSPDALYNQYFWNQNQ